MAASGKRYAHRLADFTTRIEGWARPHLFDAEDLKVPDFINIYGPTIDLAVKISEGLRQREDVRRGDILQLYSTTFLFDGHTAVKLPCSRWGADEDTIPDEFLVPTEFPIDYWGQLISSDACLPLDVKTFRRELIANLSFGFPAGLVRSRNIDPRGVIYTHFTHQRESDTIPRRPSEKVPPTITYYIIIATPGEALSDADVVTETDDVREDLINHDSLHVICAGSAKAVDGCSMLTASSGRYIFQYAIRQSEEVRLMCYVSPKFDDYAPWPRYE